MADPLSTAASLIALVQISGSIISLCYDYRKSVQDAKKSIAALQCEVQSLRDIIERLLNLLDTDGDNYLPLLHRIIENNNSFEEYEETFKKLEGRLRSPVSSWRQLGHQLSWPLKEREVTKDLEAIHRIRGILETTFMTDITSSVVEIRKSTKHLEEDVHDLKRGLPSSQQQKLQAILRWLNAPDLSRKHNELLRKRAKNTGTWLLNNESFQTWRHSNGSSLWLYGIPGCGKSVLSAVVVDHILQDNKSRKQDEALAYYHFDSGDEMICNPDTMLRSLIAQLSSWKGESPTCLESCARAHLYGGLIGNLNIFADGISQPPNEELVHILHGITKEFRRTVLVIDALDECTDQDTLLENIGSMLSWATEGLIIFLCSRTTPIISSVLEPAIQCVIEVQSEDNSGDIDIFIKEQLSTHPRLRKWTSSLRGEIRDTLSSQAHGMFRWVDCQISLLGKCVTTRDVKKTLKTLPKTLAETYTFTLQGIDEAYWSYAIKILMFLAISPIPITIKESIDILAIDFETDSVPFFDEDFRMPDELDVLTMCATLVEATPICQVATDGRLIKSVELRLAHHTVREYLLSEAFKFNKPQKCPFKDKQDVHNFASKTLLAYLLSLEEILTPDLLEERPLSRYAAELWSHYYRESQQDSTLEKLAIQLLRENGNTEPYRNWCKLFDPARPWREPDLNRKETVPPLYHLCSQGIESLVIALLRSGADPNGGDSIYRACLQTAAYGGHTGIVKALLEAGANPNGCIGLHCNSLYAAAAGGHADIVSLLLERGADLECASILQPHGSALMEASKRNHVKVVQLLMNAGANPNSIHPKKLTMNSLTVASSHGYKECVSLMLPEAETETILNALHVGLSKEANRELLELFIPFVPDEALYFAASLGRRDLIEDLMAKCAKLEEKSGDIFATALVEACGSGHLSIAMDLVKNGADVNKRVPKYYQGSHPLMSAVNGGHIEVVSWLIQQGVDVNVCCYGTGLPLHMACLLGHKAIVEMLIEHGASLTYTTGHFAGPAQAAVTGDHLNILELVVRAGADVNAQIPAYSSTSALHSAVLSRNISIFNWLIRHGADVNLGSPVALAARNGDIEMVRRLLDAGADVNGKGKSEYSMTAIHEAIQANRLEVVKYLLGVGADVHTLGEYHGGQITCLTWACITCGVEMVEELLEAGADLYTSSYLEGRYEPPLLTAARFGSVETVRALIKRGAKVNEQVEDGWSALHIASRVGNSDIVRALLFEFSADPSLALANGSLPIHSAADRNKLECIELLVRAGTDINARNSIGRTPLHWAAVSEVSAKEAIEWLLDHGADATLEEYETHMTARDNAEQMAQSVDGYYKEGRTAIIKVFDAHNKVGV